ETATLGVPSSWSTKHVRACGRIGPSTARSVHSPGRGVGCPAISLSESFGDGRARLCLSVIKAKIQRDGHFTTKGGIVRRRFDRPGAEPKQIERARQELAKGVGIGKVARLTGLGTGTVNKLKREMAASM